MRLLICTLLIAVSTDATPRLIGGSHYHPIDDEPLNHVPLSPIDTNQPLNHVPLSPIDTNQPLNHVPLSPIDHNQPLNHVPLPHIETNLPVGIARPNGGNNDCVCVPIFLCNDSDIQTDSAGTTLLRINVVDEDSSLLPNGLDNNECRGFLDVCCKSLGNTAKPEAQIYQPQCGHRNNDGVAIRISGPGFSDTNAQFGEFPWMTAILRIENIGEEYVKHYICGGSLIEPNVILTAAHCIYKHHVSSIVVRLGEWNPQHDSEPYAHQEIGVDQIIMHPEFNDVTIINNYALLILKTTAILSRNVDTICLPKENYDFTGKRCFSTGWGSKKFGDTGIFRNVLKVIDLPVFSHPNCEYLLRETRLGEYFKLHDSFVCAGGEPEKDSCTGDGGSPLVCVQPKTYPEEPDVYHQAGIVSWGIGCGEKGVPGVYTDVSKGIQWIKRSLLGKVAV